MFACVHNPDIVPNLLQHPRLNINVQNSEGKTALDITKQQNTESYTMIKSVIENNEIRKNVKSNENKTPKTKKIL